jgi:hypothetical protein
MGVKYLDLSKFDDAGIAVVFQEFKHPVYEQQHRHLGFIPDLSCIDMLFNYGEKSVEILCDTNPDVVGIIKRGSCGG